MSQLQHIEDDETRCAYCPRPAVGPCASCTKPVCADCCTLTEGGAKVWAICLDCDRRGGRSLRSRWIALSLWLVMILVVLAAATALLGWLNASRG